MKLSKEEKQAAQQYEKQLQYEEEKLLWLNKLMTQLARASEFNYEITVVGKHFIVKGINCYNHHVEYELPAELGPITVYGIDSDNLLIMEQDFDYLEAKRTEAKRTEALRKGALEKLSEEEKVALGLK